MALVQYRMLLQIIEWKVGRSNRPRTKHATRRTGLQDRRKIEAIESLQIRWKVIASDCLLAREDELAEWQWSVAELLQGTKHWTVRSKECSAGRKQQHFVLVVTIGVSLKDVQECVELLLHAVVILAHERDAQLWTSVGEELGISQRHYADPQGSPYWRVQDDERLEAQTFRSLP